jgi:hypothetical protein
VWTKKWDMSKKIAEFFPQLNKDSTSSGWDIKDAAWLKTAYSWIKNWETDKVMGLWKNDVWAKHKANGWAAALSTAYWWNYEWIVDAMTRNNEVLKDVSKVWIDEIATGWAWWDDAEKTKITEAYNYSITQLKNSVEVEPFTNDKRHYDTATWKMYKLDDSWNHIEEVVQLWKWLKLSNREITMDNWTAASLVKYMNDYWINSINKLRE